MAETDADSIRARIDTARTRAGLTRDELQERAGLSGGYLSKARKRFDPEILSRLAVACGVRAEWLTLGSGPMVAIEAHVDPIPGTNPQPFADALLLMLDPKRHRMEDLDAARRVASEVLFHLREGADVNAMARTWLDVAARLRAQGREATPTAILAFLSERTSPALSELEEATNAEVDARLRAKGMEPGQGAAVIEKLRKK